MADDEFVVTPYEIHGRVDYDKLREQFGAQALDAPLLDRIRRLAGGELHPLLARGVYYSHRDLGPAPRPVREGPTVLPLLGTRPVGPPPHLPSRPVRAVPVDPGAASACPMYIQITDDEKFWFRPGLTRAETERWGRENLADLLAVGFDPKRTHVFFDTRSIAAMYPLAVDVAKRIPYSTVKAVFGFPPSQNIGLVFYTALQTVPAFYPSWVEGRPVPCLIPCGIDQDPHFRVTRDIAESLGYPKPDPAPQPDAPRAPRGEGDEHDRRHRRQRAVPQRPAEGRREEDQERVHRGARDRRGAAAARREPRDLLGLGARGAPGSPRATPSSSRSPSDCRSGRASSAATARRTSSSGSTASSPSTRYVGRRPWRSAESLIIERAPAGAGRAPGR